MQKIQEYFDEMYKGARSKKFVLHLIRAYIPVSNVEKLWGAPMRNFRCCISEKPLAAGNNILEKINDKAKNKIVLDFMVEPFSDSNMGNTKISKNFFKEKDLGVKGKDTETYMSLTMFNEFHKWVLLKILSGDKGVKEATQPYRTVEMLTVVSTLAKTDEEKARAESLIKKAKVAIKRQEKRFAKFEETKTTMGDMFTGDLEALKAKLD